MKRILAMGVGVCLGVSLNACAAETAQARIYCLSLRFQRGSDMFGLSVLDLSSISLDTPNGELAPSFGSPSHFSGFRISDPDTGELVEEGEIDIDIPDFTDANGNGFDDFFEVSQAVSAVSSGIYSSAVDSGTVRATWGRGAGSKDGTCVLKVTSSMVGLLGDFTHNFELIEYTGPLSYTPGTNRISGSVNLTQTGDPSSQFIGPIEFIKSPTNRFDELNLQHATWTNAVSQTYKISNDIDSFLRDLTLKTNYYGFVDFDDGDPNTADPDYYTWILSIDDVNDSNGNGIPDFTDDVGSTAPRPPSLVLTQGSGALSLNISGTVGSVHEVQQTASLSSTNWTLVSSITLTNDPQTVTLPLPTNMTSFWRVRAL
jgi:hypothetical protein